MRAMHVMLSRLPLAGLARAGALGIIAIAAGMIFTMPRVVLNEKLHDYFVALDGGWRIAVGQLPHLDFHTPVGVVWYFTHGLFALAAAPDPRIVAWTSMAGGVVCVALAWPIVWSRLSPILAACAVLIIFFVACSPRMLGYYFDSSTWIASYNRWGWSLLAIIAIALLVPPKPGASSLRDGLLVGVCAGILIWLKATYGVAAVAALVATAVLRPATRAMMKPAAAVAFLALALLATPLGLAYVADLTEAYAYAPMSDRSSFVIGIVMQSVTALIVIGVQLAALAGRADWRDLTLLAGWTIGSLGLAVQNAFGEVALLPILLICALAFKPPARLAHWVWALAALAIVAARPLAKDAASVAWATAQAHGWTEMRTEIDPFGDGLLVVDAPGSATNEAFLRSLQTGDPAGEGDERQLWDADKARSVRAGIELLRAEGTDGAVIANLAFANPFPFALGLVPPCGANQWLDVDRTWSPERPDIRRLIGDATVVVEPKFESDWTNAAAAIAAVEPELAGRWTLAADTPLFRIWKAPENGAIGVCG